MKLTLHHLILLLIFPVGLHAQQMSYQGRLTDDTGAAKPGPQATISFSFFDAATEGDEKWGPFATNVDLIDGRFSVKLGDATGDDGHGRLLKDSFGGSRFLQLTVGTDSALPRQEVLFSPNAFHAIEADHALNADEATHALAADEAQHAVAADFATNAGHATTATAIGNPAGETSPLTIDFPNSRVGIGTSSPSALLDINGDMNVGSFSTASDSYINLWTAGGNNYSGGIKLRSFSDDWGFDIEHDDDKLGLNIIRHHGPGNSASAMFIKRDTGNVGIGTTDPDATLDVNGTARVTGTLTAPDLKSGREIRMDFKSPETQDGVWPGQWVDLQAWRNRPDGCRMTIYAQHEISGDIRTYEGTFVFEEAGYATNPDFPSTFVRGACEFGFAWTTFRGNSFKLGDNAGVTYATLMADHQSWVHVYDYKPAGNFGGVVEKKSLTDGLLFWVGFHPHVSGRVVVKDN